MAFETLEDSFKAMRDSALHSGGEFSFENLVYKELRNEGYFDKIKKFRLQRTDKKLSLYLGKRRKL